MLPRFPDKTLGGQQTISSFVLLINNTVPSYLDLYINYYIYNTNIHNNDVYYKLILNYDIINI